MGGEATIFNSLVLAAVHEERRMILGQRLGVIHTSECVDGIEASRVLYCPGHVEGASGEGSTVRGFKASQMFLCKIQSQLLSSFYAHLLSYRPWKVP